MENIIVCDNFLNEEELNNVLEIIKNKKWKWGHLSSNKQLIETPFWNVDLTNDDYFSIYIKQIIEKFFLKKFKLFRVYANGQTFGQDGSYHADCEDSNTFTFCLYVSKIDKKYIETAGGHIFFKIPELKYKICFEPIFNRGIFFPSNYIHKSSSFCRYVMDMRICIAWKFEEI